MVMKRAQVFIPEELLKKIDHKFGKRKRSWFITQVIQKELKRISLLETLKETAGAWKDEDHAELTGGTDKWVEKLRSEMDSRMEVFDECNEGLSPGHLRDD